MTTIVVGAKYLAERYNVTPVHIYRTLSSNPDHLPPPLRLPGSRRLRWRLDFVERWESEHIAFVTESAVLGTVRRRGRPTKAEQIARRAIGNEYRP